MFIEIEGKSNSTIPKERSIFYIKIEEIAHIENRIADDFYVLSMNNGTSISHISNEDGQKIIGIIKSL